MKSWKGEELREATILDNGMKCGQTQLLKSFELDSPLLLSVSRTTYTLSPNFELYTVVHVELGLESVLCPLVYALRCFLESLKQYVRCPSSSGKILQRTRDYACTSSENSSCFVPHMMFVSCLAIERHPS